MKRNDVAVDLGIHGIFLNRRWEDPDNMFRVVRQIGLQHFQFCADLLDPFFGGDSSYQREMVAKYRRAADRHQVEIVEYYTGKATHVFHGLGHSSEVVRERMWAWITRAMELAVAMDIPKFAGHLHAFSSETLADDGLRTIAEERMLEDLSRMQVLAREKGLSEIGIEVMYTPAELPWTIDGAQQMLRNLNRDSALPLRLTLDTGHLASLSHGGEGRDRSYLGWIQQFGAVSEFIHIHQTTPTSSAHWPFTQERNAAGHIDVGAVVGALATAHESFAQDGKALGLEQVDRNLLILEVFPPSMQTDEEVISDLEESVAFLRRSLPDGGFVPSAESS